MAGTYYFEDIDFSPDGKSLLASFQSGSIRIWDLEKNRFTQTYNGSHQGRVYGVAFAPGGASFATAGQDKTVKVWDLKTIEYALR